MAILRLTLSNQLGELARINALSEFLDEEGVPPAVAQRVKLVVEELVVNVIQHAFDDGGHHSILLDIRTEPGGITIVVEDDGKAFDPRKAPTPAAKDLMEAGKRGGLGMTIIKRAVRDLDYERIEGRNRVRAFIATSGRGT